MYPGLGAQSVLFCKNCQQLEVTRMRSIQEELEFFDDESLIQWYIGTRAVEEFRTNNGGRYPGKGSQNKDNLQEEQAKLSVFANQILKKLSPNNG